MIFLLLYVAVVSLNVLHGQASPASTAHAVAHATVQTCAYTAPPAVTFDAPPTQTIHTLTKTVHVDKVCAGCSLVTATPSSYPDSLYTSTVTETGFEAHAFQTEYGCCTATYFQGFSSLNVTSTTYLTTSTFTRYVVCGGCEATVHTHLLDVPSGYYSKTVTSSVTYMSELACSSHTTMVDLLAYSNSCSVLHTSRLDRRPTGGCVQELQGLSDCPWVCFNINEAEERTLHCYNRDISKEKYPRGIWNPWDCSRCYPSCEYCEPSCTTVTTRGVEALAPAPGHFRKDENELVSNENLSQETGNAMFLELTTVTASATPSSIVAQNPEVPQDLESKSKQCPYLCMSKKPVKFFCCPVDITGKQGPRGYGVTAACYKLRDKFLDSGMEQFFESKQVPDSSLSRIEMQLEHADELNDQAICFSYCTINKIGEFQCSDKNVAEVSSEFDWLTWACINNLISENVELTGSKTTETDSDIDVLPRDAGGVGDPSISGQFCPDLPACKWLCRLDALKLTACFQDDKSGQTGPIGLKWHCRACPPIPKSTPDYSNFTPKTGINHQLSTHEDALHSLPTSGPSQPNVENDNTGDRELDSLQKKSIAHTSSSCKALTTMGLIDCPSCSSHSDCRYLCQVVASKDNKSLRYCEPTDATGMYVEELGTILCIPCSSIHATGSTSNSSPAATASDNDNGDDDGINTQHTTAHSLASAHNSKHDFSLSMPPHKMPRYRLGCPKAQFKVGCTFLCHHDVSSSSNNAEGRTWFKTCASDDQTDLSKGVKCTGCGPVKVHSRNRRLAAAASASASAPHDAVDDSAAAAAAAGVNNEMPDGEGGHASFFYEMPPGMVRGPVIANGGGQGA